MGVRLCLIKRSRKYLFSGKLDLRGSLEDVVEIICQSLFLRQETDKENNIIILK